MTAIEDARAALAKWDNVPHRWEDRSRWSRDDLHFVQDKQRDHASRTAPEVAAALRALLAEIDPAASTPDGIHLVAHHPGRVTLFDSNGDPWPVTVT